MDYRGAIAPGGLRGAYGGHAGGDIDELRIYPGGRDIGALRIYSGRDRLDALRIYISGEENAAGLKRSTASRPLWGIISMKAMRAMAQERKYGRHDADA
jgi:hypothetical protein